MTKNTATLTLGLVLSALFPARAAASQGKTLFEENCASCHTIGGGDSVGPDLKGVADRRKAGWIKRIIIEPDKLAAESDPEQLALVKKWGMEMPNLGISPENAVEILEYLAGGSHPAKPAAGKQAGVVSPVPAAEEKPAGSPANGRELFFGGKKLSAGGPACVSCHSISPGNMAAGGSLAVSLSGAFKKLGATGIKAVLTNLPFPVKAAAFKNRPIVEAELSDLAAFLEEAGKAGPEPGAGSGKLFFSALAGVLGALVLIALVWSGRKKKGVKDEILSRQAKTF